MEGAAGHKAKVAFSLLRMLFPLISSGTSLPLSPHSRNQALTGHGELQFSFPSAEERATDLI